MNCTPEEMERAEAAYEAAHADEIEAMEKWAAEEEAKREALLKKYDSIEGVGKMVEEAKRKPECFPTEFLEYCLMALDRRIDALYDDPMSQYAPTGEIVAAWKEPYANLRQEFNLRSM